MLRVQEEISLRLLGVSRSGLYYEPVGTSAEELALMRCIDELHLRWPFYGSRKLCEALRATGITVNRELTLPCPSLRVLTTRPLTRWL